MRSCDHGAATPMMELRRGTEPQRARPPRCEAAPPRPERRKAARDGFLKRPGAASVSFIPARGGQPANPPSVGCPAIRADPVSTQIVFPLWCYLRPRHLEEGWTTTARYRNTFGRAGTRAHESGERDREEMQWFHGTVIVGSGQQSDSGCRKSLKAMVERVRAHGIAV